MLRLPQQLSVDDSNATADSVSDRRIIEILEEYLCLKESGEADVDEFIARHQEFAEELPGLIESLNALHGINGALDVSAGPAAQGHDSESVGWEDLSSQTFGDYRIVREIGRGGMGVVYEAEQLSLGRRVALKVLPLSVVLDQQLVSRFMIESQAAARLHHPNIIPIFSVGREDGLHCYSMQLIDGQSLDQILDRHETVDRTASVVRESIDRAVRWMIQAADALDHAHQRGVIHRDIKPSNLMIDKDANLWITDFGLARCKADSSLTRSGAVVGTWRYMSPEQTSGKPLIDHRSDIYSLGLTLYQVIECLALGKQHGDAEAFDSWSDHKRSESPPPLRRRTSEIARDLETVVMKAAAHDPADRYQTAGEFADDLQRYLDGKTIHAKRPSLPDRVFKWTSRHRSGVLAGLVFAAATLVASLSATAWIAHQQLRLNGALAREQLNRETAEARSKQLREILDHFGLLAAEKLRGVPGAEAVRKELVRDVLAHYEWVAATAEESETVDDELADVHFRAARLVDELGMAKRAMDAYRKAIVLLDRSAERLDNDDRMEMSFRAAVCRNNLAVLEASAGDDAGALEHYHAAQAIHSRIRSSYHGAERELASVYANIGLLLAETNDADAAEEYLNQSLALLRKLESQSPSLRGRLTITTTLNNLGYLFQDSDFERARTYNRRAIAGLTDQELDRFDLDEDAKADVEMHRAVAMHNRAALLAKAGDDESAIESYRQSIDSYRKCLDARPWSVEGRENLSVTYNNLGRLLRQLGRRGDAAHAFERSKTWVEALAQTHPEESRYRVSLGAVLNNLGKLSSDSGDLTLAIRQFREAIEHQTHAAPATNEHHRLAALAKTYANYEAALRAAGEFVEAEKIQLLRSGL